MRLLTLCLVGLAAALSTVGCDNSGIEARQTMIPADKTLEPYCLQLGLNKRDTLARLSECGFGGEIAPASLGELTKDSSPLEKAFSLADRIRIEGPYSVAHGGNEVIAIDFIGEHVRAIEMNEPASDSSLEQLFLGQHTKNGTHDLVTDLLRRGIGYRAYITDSRWEAYAFDELSRVDTSRLLEYETWMLHRPLVDGPEVCSVLFREGVIASVKCERGYR